MPTLQTPFFIDSFTRSITDWLVRQLGEGGKVDLDARFSATCPGSIWPILESFNAHILPKTFPHTPYARSIEIGSITRVLCRTINCGIKTR
jgi:hypothetical protein